MRLILPMQEALDDIVRKAMKCDLRKQCGGWTSQKKPNSDRNLIAMVSLTTCILNRNYLDSVNAGAILSCSKGYTRATKNALGISKRTRKTISRAELKKKAHAGRVLGLAQN